MEKLRFNGKQLPEWLISELYKVSPEPGVNELLGLVIDDYIERKEREISIMVGHIVLILDGGFKGHWGTVTSINSEEGLVDIAIGGISLTMKKEYVLKA